MDKVGHRQSKTNAFYSFYFIYTISVIHITDKHLPEGWNIRYKMQKLEDGATYTGNITVDKDGRKARKNEFQQHRLSFT